MFTNWHWNWICCGKTMLSLTPVEPPFRFSLSNLMQWFSDPGVRLPWEVQTTWWETEGDKNKKARWLLSAPLVPFLFLSSSFSTSEGLSSLQPHHGECAHGATYSCIGQQDLPGIRWGKASGSWGVGWCRGSCGSCAAQHSSGGSCWEMECRISERWFSQRRRPLTYPQRGKDTSQTDSSCLMATGNMDPRYFQITYFLYAFTPTNRSCL